MAAQEKVIVRMEEWRMKWKQVIEVQGRTYRKTTDGRVGGGGDVRLWKA